MFDRIFNRLFYGTRYKRTYVPYEQCTNLTPHSAHLWTKTFKYAPASFTPKTYWCEGVEEN